MISPATTAATIGNPAGRIGTVSPAMVPPAIAAYLAKRPLSCGARSAANTAGNAASRPSASGSVMLLPATAPVSVEVSQMIRKQNPLAADSCSAVA